MQDTENLKEEFNLAKAQLEDLARESESYSDEQLSALNYVEEMFSELSSNIHPYGTDSQWEGIRPLLTKFFTKLENQAKILTGSENL